jgi:predicted RNA binding protein YcfA (HicA-like mRNA interferase family)
VSKHKKLKEKILTSKHNQGYRFDEVVAMLEHFGLRHKRTKGSHHQYEHPLLQGQLNLQPDKNGEVKPYQLREIRFALTALNEQENTPKRDE